MSVNERILERILKALANRRRLAILKLLKDKGPQSVGDIASAIKLSVKATSKHLNKLAISDLVDRNQKSSQVFYSLAYQHQFIKSIINIL